MTNKTTISNAEELRLLMEKINNPKITSDGSIFKEAAHTSSKKRLVESASMKTKAVEIIGQLRKIGKGIEQSGAAGKNSGFASQAHQALTDLYQMMPHFDMADEQKAIRSLIQKANSAVRGEYAGNFSNEVVNDLYPIMQKLQVNENPLLGLAARAVGSAVGSAVASRATDSSLSEDDSVTLADTLEDLIAIRDEMSEKLNMAEELIRSSFPEEYPAAEAYWIAHIKSALGGHGYPTHSETFEKTLQAIESKAYGDSEDEY